MNREILIKAILLIATLGIFIVAIFGVSFYSKTYSQIFRLSHIQIKELLIKHPSSCLKITTCKLWPGDILIRRYITSRTWAMDRLTHPYFTHSAMYIGDDYIVEAVGSEKRPGDDIQIAKLSTSDWWDDNMNDWVVIRSKKIGTKIDTITASLKTIASDPEYRFGFTQDEYKRATCADLIFRQLNNNGIIYTDNIPKIITPDYLFFTISQNLDFEIVGYNLPTEK